MSLILNAFNCGLLAIADADMHSEFVDPAMCSFPTRTTTKPCATSLKVHLSALKRALARHAEGSARVIPVILRPCDWLHSPFAHLLAAPTDGKPITRWPDRDEAFLDVVQ